MSKISQVLLVIVFVELFAPGRSVRADIYQWEYINPANPDFGKQPSTTLAPDGAGANAVQGANLSNRNLTKAYLIGADLGEYSVYDYEEDAWVYHFTNLSGSNLSHADLSGANLSGAALSGANFTLAEIRGANLTRGVADGMGGFTLSQLYSTASYLAHDLTGVHLDGNNFAGGNFIGQNLSSARLFYVDGTGADFSGVDFSQAALGSNFSNANLSQAKFTGATFGAGTLAGANFTGAEVRGATFYYGLLSKAQLYSTASYLAGDLSGVGLHGDYPAINLAGKNLTGASFGSSGNLSAANFNNANLTSVYFVGSNLTNANFTGANLTGGSVGDQIAGANFSNAVVRDATLWGISKAQLYSTASYQTGDLRGIYLYNDQTNWNFAGKNLSGAEFQSSMNFAGSNFTGANLAGAYLSYVSFQNANLSQANLADANFVLSKLSGANLAGADVRGANFMRDVNSSVGGLSPAQLTSTASYVANDLTGIKLRYNVLTGVNLQGKTLTNVDLVGATLNGANFSGADIRGALLERDVSRNVGGITIAQLQSTASYAAHDLQGIHLGGNNLAGINLAGQNLSNAKFDSEEGYGSNLSGANFTGANLTNARVGATNFTGASFVQANLTGVALTLANLTNANFSQANLSRAGFSGYVIVVQGGEEGGGGYYNFAGADLTGVNLAGADLTRANFSGTYDEFGSPFPGATLTNANLSGADARGASFQFATMTGANTTNLIQTSGHVAGLNLPSGASLVVRDYDVDFGADVAILVDQQMTMGAGGKLRMEFDADAWGSTISFTPGIPVALSGVLELAFDAGVDPGAQLGRTFDLFDWTGVSALGAFSVTSVYGWDLSRLYSTGEVTLVAAGGTILGDFNGDSFVNGADLDRWRMGFGIQSNAAHAQGDADGDRDVDADDFLVWQRRLASTAPAVSLNVSAPEPATVAMLLTGLMVLYRPRKGRHNVVGNLG